MFSFQQSEKMVFNSKDLDRTKLPLRRNVMEYFLFLRQKAIARGASLQTSYLQFKPEVAREIRGLWRVKNIPLTSNDMVLKKLKEILDGYKKVAKNPHTINMVFWDELLIISHCKCGIELGNNCTCENEKKIPSHANFFYIDQCGPRARSLVDDECDKSDSDDDDDDRMDIDDVDNAAQEVDPAGFHDDIFEDLDLGAHSDVDTQEVSDNDDEALQGPRPGTSKEMFAFPTAPKVRRIITSSSAGSRMPDSPPFSAISSASVGYSPGQSEVEEFNRSQGQLTDLSGLDDGPPRTIRHLHLTHYCPAADRAGVKDRPAAYLATSLLRDAKVNLVVDRLKIRREREIMRFKAVLSLASNKLLKCISFDGKRLETSHVKQGQIVIEENVEHFVLVKEPGSRYIGHITPRNEEGKSVGAAAYTFLAIKQYLRENDYSMDDIVAVSCDGTNTNTGNRNGIIVNLENDVDRPLQWFVCLFHFNELPFKKLYENLYGESKAPDIYGGELGKEIQTFSVEKYPVSTNFNLFYTSRAYSFYHYFRLY